MAIASIASSTRSNSSATSRYCEGGRCFTSLDATTASIPHRPLIAKEVFRFLEENGIG